MKKADTSVCLFHFRWSSPLGTAPLRIYNANNLLIHASKKEKSRTALPVPGICGIHSGLKLKLSAILKTVSKSRFGASFRSLHNALSVLK